jgi:hypothetical protein
MGSEQKSAGPRQNRAWPLRYMPGPVLYNGS